MFRAMGPGEREEVLTLWKQVFGDGDAYFRAYFEADPGHRDRYTRVAVKGSRIVSAVHASPRVVRFGGGTLRCAGFANVATLEEHRGKGLCSRLLSDLADVCREDGFDFGLLFTDINGFYARLGWETASTPYFRIRLAGAVAEGAPDYQVLPAHPLPHTLRRVFDGAARVLWPLRDATYWEGWVASRLRPEGDRMRVLLSPDADAPYGYAFLRRSEHDTDRMDAWEFLWLGDPEPTLRCAAAYSLSQGARVLQVSLPAEKATLSAMERLGRVEVASSTSAMTLRLGASEEVYAEVRRLQELGANCCGEVDSF